MQVLVSAGRLGLGGVLTHLRLLCLELRKAGVQVVVFANGSDWPRTKIEEAREAGVRFFLPPEILWNSPRIAAFYSMVSWLWLVPRGAVSLYCIGAGRSHRYLQRLCSARTVSIYHEIVAPPDRTSLSGRCIATADASIANSRKIGEIMARDWPSKPIRVIPFLTTGFDTPSSVARENVPLRQLRVVYLGRLVSQKRPDKLVKEWCHIAARLGAARLDVYGNDADGEMLPELRNFVARNKLEDSIQIHGPYDNANLSAILDRADVVVLPSLWEGLPLVLVEAMHRGIPIVACAAGGTEELGHDNPDVIITSCDWEDFVAGLEAMARQIREGKINPARLSSWTNERYGFEKVSSQWLEALLRPRKFFSI